MVDSSKRGQKHGLNRVLLLGATFEQPCYNPDALHESKSGGRCFAFKSQISDLKFEFSKERKVRTPKGSEPANGGASGT